jgi:DNA repair exonuclease SbcCD ATPase subunit
MEFIEKIIAENIDGEGKLNVDKAMESISAEISNHLVPKSKYTAAIEKLTSAEDTLKKLQNEHGDIKKLQEDVKSYQEKAKQAEAEAKQIKAESTVREALRKAGGKDVDYLMFKLGTPELGDNGEVKDLDNKIKDLKETVNDWFESPTEPTPEKGNKGYKPIDTELKTGSAPDEKAAVSATFAEALKLAG